MMMRVLQCRYAASYALNRRLSPQWARQRLISWPRSHTSETEIWRRHHDRRPSHLRTAAGPAARLPRAVREGRSAGADEASRQSRRLFQHRSRKRERDRTYVGLRRPRRPYQAPCRDGRRPRMARLFAEESRIHEDHEQQDIGAYVLLTHEVREQTWPPLTRAVPARRC